MRLNKEEIDRARAEGRKVRVYFTEDLEIENMNGPITTEQQEEICQKESKSIKETALAANKIDEATKSKSGLVRIEAIHSGLTRNLTYYDEKNLKASVKTWLSPYEKPVLTHHNKYGEPVGRVKAAKFNSQSLLVGDRGCVEIFIDVTDPDAKQKVEDGRYTTVSIGAETDSVVCSICGIDLLNGDGWCGHSKGEKYNKKGELDPKGQVCYWIIGKLNFDEISFVNIPSDPYAMAVGMTESVPEDSEHEESTEESVSSSENNGSRNGGRASEQFANEEAASNANGAEAQKTQKEGAETLMPDGIPEGLKASEELLALISANESLKAYAESLWNYIVTAVAEQENSKGLQTQIETLTQEKQELTTKNEELVNKNQELTGQAEQHVQAAAQWEIDRAALLEQASRATEELRNNIIERIIESKIALGKEKQEAREELQAKYSARSMESLIYTLQDLSEENTSRIPDKVNNPGLVKDPNESQTETAGAAKPKELTVQDFTKATVDLFNGPGYTQMKNKKGMI